MSEDTRIREVIFISNHNIFMPHLHSRAVVQRPVLIIAIAIAIAMMVGGGWLLRCVVKLTPTAKDVTSTTSDSTAVYRPGEMRVAYCAAVRVRVCVECPTCQSFSAEYAKIALQ